MEGPRVEEAKQRESGGKIISREMCNGTGPLNIRSLIVEQKIASDKG